MELGCFLAGALVSSQGHVVTEEVTTCLEPVCDFLAIVFFASIGNLSAFRHGRSHLQIASADVCV